MSRDVTRSILIECMIRRKAGSRIMLDGKEYHFQPRPDLGSPSSHVCPVANQTHVKTFLRISEAYTLYMGSDIDELDADDADAADDLPDLDPALPPDADAPAENTGKDTDEDADDEDDGEDEDEGEGEDLDAMSEEDLRATYAAENGRPAPGNTKRETIVAKLKELRSNG